MNPDGTHRERAAELTRIGVIRRRPQDSTDEVGAQHLKNYRSYH